ncbi:hypothetical protein AS593_06895 [Caulobacter vibrioides]|nr:hypothetical protein AS593_06895 [Caulobacter vibrioides]
MTSVVVWTRREVITLGDKRSVHGDGIWVAADSRISTPGQVSTRKILTDAAAKLLPLQVKLFEGAEHGPGFTPAYEGQLGFAYAGSTFSATMTYALAASCLQSLCGAYDDPFPSLEDLVGLVCAIATRYVVDAAAPFEACILGAQPYRRGLTDSQCFHLTYDPGQRTMVSREIDLAPEGSFLLLGSRQAELTEALTAGFAQTVEYNPTRALAEIITRDGVDEIGGALQLGRARRGGFRLLPTWGYAAGAPAYPSLVGLKAGGALQNVGAFWVWYP